MLRREITLILILLVGLVVSINIYGDTDNPPSTTETPIKVSSAFDCLTIYLFNQMKTNILLSVIVALVLAITGTLSASAAGALTVSRTAMTMDTNFNYSNFEVQVSNAGTYYAEF